jgi:hypothetical protein
MPGAVPQSSSVTNDDSPNLSMQDLENEIVDITSSSTSSPPTKVKLLFAKSKGMFLEEC